jgi:hypothetical protein
MACKHFYKNTPLPQADEIFGYIQRTQAGNRNADAILKILQNHNLISPRKFSTGMHHIRMGKDVFEQYKHVGYVNEVARKHYGGKNLLNITERGRVYGNRYKGNSNIDYTVTVNENVLQEIGEAMDILTDEVPDALKQAEIEYYQSLKGDALLSEQARLENKSDQQLASRLPKADTSQLGRVVERLTRNFEKAGIKVDVKLDIKLDALGEVRTVNGKPTIYINPRKMREDTAFHEFAHIYVDILGLNNPLVQEVLQKFQDTPMGRKIREQYTMHAEREGLSEKDTEEKILKEIVVTAIGLEGAKIVRKNPSKMQSLLNRLFRAIGKLLGINQDAAAQLAEQMWKATMPKHATVQFSNYAQQSLEEENLKKVIEDVRLVLKGFLIEEQRKRSEGQEETAAEEKLKRELNRLENARTAQDLFSFVGYMRNLVVRADEFMTRVENEYHDDMTVEESVSMLKDIYNVQKYIKALAPLDLYPAIAAEVREKSKLKELSPTEPIKELETAMSMIVTKIDDLSKRYLDNGAVIYAGILEQMAPSTTGVAIDNIIKRMREQQRLIGKPDETEAIKAIRRRREKGEINEVEERAEIIEEYAKQLDQKKATKSALIRQLREDFKSLNMLSAQFDPIIFSDDMAIQLHVLRQKEAVEDATERTMDVQSDIYEAYEEYKAETGKGDTNTEAFNAPWTEVVTYNVWNPEKKAYEKQTLLQLVQPTDVNKYYEEQRSMEDMVMAKYIEPANERVAKLVADGVPRTRAEQFAEVKALYKKAASVRRAWHAENSEKTKDAETRYKKLQEELAQKQEDMRNIDLASPTRDVQLADLAADIQMIRKNLAKAKSGSVWMGRFAQPKTGMFVNPRYEALKNNKPAFKYYNTMLGIYKEQQAKAPSNLPINPWDDNFSYAMPSVYRDSRERLLSGYGKEGVSAWLEDTFTLQQTDFEFGTLTGLNGERLRVVPTFFGDRIDAKEITRDLATSVLMFAHQANLYEAKSQVLSEVMIMQDLMDARGVLDTEVTGSPVVNRLAAKLGIQRSQKARTNRRADHLREFTDSFFFGQKQLTSEFEFMGRKFSTTKLSGALASFTALNLLGFNLKQAFNQKILDNERLVEEAMASQYFTVQDLAKARAMLNVELATGGVMKDVNSFMPKSKLVQYMRTLNAMVDLTGLGSLGKAGSAARRVGSAGEILMTAQEAADFQTTAARALAIGNNIIVEDAEGNRSTLWEAFNMEGKRYKFKKGLKRVFTDEEGNEVLQPFKVNEVRNVLGGLYKRTNQLKGDFNQFIAQRRAWGIQVGLFRKWMSPSIRRKYGWGRGKLHVDFETGDVTEGMYWSTLRYLNNSIKDQLSFAKQYAILDPMEKANVRRTAAESAFAVLSMVVTYLAASLASDYDEEDPERMALMFVAYQARRLEAELSGYNIMQAPFNPIGVGGDTLRLLKSPAASVRQLSLSLTLLDQLMANGRWAVGLGGEETEKKVFYQRRSGAWEKGDRKIWSVLTKLFPGVRGLATSTEYEDSIKWFDKPLY